ncbi:MAG: CHAT domain-containing protein [Bacteroidales bacterium]|nr:CHAT domain-containing protein [Bacteroidales bacterium]
MKKFFIVFFATILILNSCDTLNNLLNRTVDDVTNGIPDVNINPNVDNVVNNVIDNAVDEQVRNLKYGVDKKVSEARDKIIDSYDVTDFHYAVTFGDNSSLFETKENFQELGNLSIYALDPNSPPIVKARSYNSAGEMFYVTGHYEAAETSFFKALETYEELNILDSTEAILTMNNIGLLYLTMGKYSSSEQYLNQAMDYRKKNFEDTAGYAATLNNIGVLYQNQGKYNESEKYLNEATNFIKKNVGENDIQYAIVLNNLAMMYQLVNRTSEAEKLLTNAIEIAKTQTKEKSSTYVRLNVNLALLYQATKRYNEAEQIYLKSIETTKHRIGTKHPDYAVLLRNLAALYMEMERYSEVEELLTEAQIIYREKFGTENPQFAKTTFELGVYFNATGNYDRARGLFEQAIDVQKKNLEEHHPDLTESYEYLALNYWQQKNAVEARKYYSKALDNYIFEVNTYFEAMSDAEKTLFWNKIQHKFIRYYNFVAENYNEIPDIASDLYSYHIQTKALLLNSSRKVKARILNSNNKELIAKYDKWQDLKNYTAKLYALTNQELIDRKINLDSLIEVTENLEKEISDLSADFKLANEQKIIGYNDIHNNLNQNECAIEIIRVEKYDNLKSSSNIFYMAVVASKEKVNPEIIVFENGNEMETTYSREYQKAIMNGKNMDKFYDYYWKGIDVATKNTENIFLSLDGIYNQINVNTILLPNGNYVIDEKRIYFLTNTKDAIALKTHLNNPTKLNAKNATLVGFPDYLMDLPADFSYIPPLPGTKVEVENITEIMKKYGWKITLFMNKEATETNLKEVNNPFVLHIATHGYFIESSDENISGGRSFGVEPSRAITNPLLRSGLLLAGADKTIQDIDTKNNTENDDGILNAYEAMTMNLDNTRLVILSACQTGLGDIKTGEGVYGLQRSFQIAGAQSIITSLWEVSDEGTQDLMSAFYRYWLESGDEYEAFRKARLDIKEKYKYPYFWGAFVLIGK